MLCFKKILVPIDFSKESELALQWAVKLAKDEGESTIFLLHVLPYVVDPTYLVGWTDDLVGLRWDQAKKDLVQWEKKVPESIHCEAILKKGRTSDEIARVCDEKEISLVLMTTTDRRGVRRFFHPNTSDATLHSVGCPILVLHLDEKATHIMAESA